MGETSHEYSIEIFVQKVLPLMVECKEKMIKADVTRACHTCPVCGKRKALKLRRSTYNNHIHGACITDGCPVTFME